MTQDVVSKQPFYLDSLKQQPFYKLQIIHSYFRKKNKKLKMEQVCEYFQCGFCMFGEKCRKHHMKEICPTQGCKKKLCTKRQPKMCKFFQIQQSCKFGEECSYKHDTSQLINRVVLLEELIEGMTEKINDLTEEVNTIKRNAHVELKDISYKYDHCDFTGCTSTDVKGHVTIKHKSSNHPCKECSFKTTPDSELKRHIFTSRQKETPIKEIEWCESLNDSLVLSLEKRRGLWMAQTYLHLLLTNFLSLTPCLVLLLPHYSL